MKALFYCLYFILISDLLNAQQADSSGYNDRFTIKINPLQALVGEGRLEIERKINANSYAEIMLGYLYRSEYFWNGDLQAPFDKSSKIYGRGYKVGIGYKLLLNELAAKKSVYITPQLFYKSLSYYGWESFNYYSVLDLKVKNVRYQVFALQINCGRYKMIKRLIFDYYLGIGIRYKVGLIEAESVRPEVEISSPRRLESAIYPSFHLGCNVGYIF